MEALKLNPFLTQLEKLIESSVNPCIVINDDREIVFYNTQMESLLQLKQVDLPMNKLDPVLDELAGSIDLQIGEKILAMKSIAFYDGQNKYYLIDAVDVTPIQSVEREISEQRIRQLYNKADSDIKYMIKDITSSIKVPTEEMLAELDKKSPDLKVIKKDADSINHYLSKKQHLFNILQETKSNHHKFKDFVDEVYEIYDEPEIELINSVSESTTLYFSKSAWFILANELIKNSIDALENTENKKIEINYTKVPGFHLIEFSDNGDGIDGDFVNQVFAPHYSTKTSDRAIGLGLTFVHDSLESMGGHIEVIREEDKTTFNLYIPERF
jgi:signal transduction histidine kinase